MRLQFLPLLAAALVVATRFPSDAAPGESPFVFRAAGRPAATQRVPFMVHLPLRDEAGLERFVTLQGTPGTQAFHRWLTPQQFAAAFGPTPAAMAAAVAALRSAGATVDRVSAQFIDAHASAAVVERRFGARLATFRDSGGRERLGSRTALVLPPALRSLGADIEGLAYRGEGRPMFHLGPPVDGARATGAAAPLNRYGPFGPLWFDDAKQAYQFPASTYADGKGVTVATVNEADFNSDDLKAYLQHERFGSGAGYLAPLPVVKHVLVPGAPGFAVSNGASFEADVDTQTVGGTAPGATVLGYTTDNYDFPTDFLQVYNTINYTNSADIVSTSYGACELFFTAPYSGGIDETLILRALHDVFLQGNSQGITYTVSSGDSTELACPEVAYFAHPNAHKNYRNVPSVNIPASDPNVVSVGGGNLITSYDRAAKRYLTSTYVSENAYADRETPSDDYGYGNLLTNDKWGAGTGQSTVFRKPAWQAGVTPGISRSVPDVGLFVGGCFSGDPSFVQPCRNDVSHWTATFAAQTYEVIGTSIAAPEFAALLADLEQLNGSGAAPGAGRLGNVGPMLYASSTSAIYHKNIPGYDGVTTFGGGTSTATWLPSYGLGSVFNHVPFPGPVAGIPQTATNP